MKNNTLLGLMIAGAALLSTVASSYAEAMSPGSGGTYRVTCTDTPSGYSWVENTVGLEETLDFAGACINEGGKPTIRSTNRGF